MKIASGVYKTVFVFLILGIALPGVFSQGADESAVYEDELSNIVDEFNSLKEELADARSAYRKLKEDYIVKTKDDEVKFAQAESQRVNLQSQLDVLRAKEQSWQVQRQQTQDLIKNKEQAIAELNQGRQQVSQQIQEYQKRIVQLESENTIGIGAQVKSLQEKISQLQNDSSLKDAQVKSLQEKMAQQTVSAQDKDNTLAGLQQAQQEALKKQYETAAKLKDAESELEKLRNDRMAFQTQVEVLKAKEESLVTQNEQQSNSLKEKDKTVTDLTEKFQQFPDQVKEYEGKLAGLANDKLVLENTLNEYKGKELLWQKKQEEMAQEISNKDSSIQGLQADIKDFPGKMEELKKQNAGLTERNNILFKDNKLFKQKMDGYSRKLYQVALLKDRLLKENAILHYNLGVSYLQKQQYNEAIVEFEKDLELNPDDGAAHYNLGLIYAEYLDNKPKAIKHFKRYILLDPKDKDVDRAKKYVFTWEMWEDEKIEPHPQFIEK